MKLTFLGTRGGIIARSKEHYRHSILLVEYRGTRILLDCGFDWLKKISSLHVDALFLTHGHPDHVGGLKHGAPCPVYATKETWRDIKNYSIEKRKVIRPRDVIMIGPFIIEPFAVAHSLRAPAVGYKITAGKKTIFYVSDLVKIKQRKKALADVDVYIGDGAIVTRTLLVRKKDSTVVGHVPIREQIAWCKQDGVKKAIFTHCGSEIVKGNKKDIQKKITALKKQYGVSVAIAIDGLKIVL